MKLAPNAATESLVLSPGEVDLPALRRIHAGGARLELAGAARAGLLAAQATVRRIVEAGEVVYGINTGFGKLAQTIIPPERLAELQRNLVLSHSVGTGVPLPDGVVRLVLATKAVSLARGHSGVRPEIVDALLALFNAGLLPRIPSKGSVGPAPIACQRSPRVGFPLVGFAVRCHSNGPCQHNPARQSAHSWWS